MATVTEFRGAKRRDIRPAGSLTLKSPIIISLRFLAGEEIVTSQHLWSQASPRLNLCISFCLQRFVDLWADPEEAIKYSPKRVYERSKENG
jgi:hypothetical protein